MLPDPEGLADQLLDITGHRRPPIDVRSILGRWSQLSVIETELDGDGFFVDLGEIGGEIFVKKGRQEARTRFTLAHELGHFLLRHHIRGEQQKQIIENWCNRFAAELLLPRLMIYHHLKSGGLQNFTKRIQEGPTLFQVSEKTFYLRTTRLFPISIMNVLVSNSDVSVIDEYRNKKLEASLGLHETPCDEEIKSFMRELAEIGTQQQQKLRRFDQTWLARRIYKNTRTHKFLLVLLERT